VAATPVGLECVVLRTEGDVPFPVDCYRPSGTISGGTVVLLPDPVDSLATWEGLARLFAERGHLVFVPQIAVRHATASLAVWGRPEDPGTSWASAWEEVVAVLAHAGAVSGSGGPVVLGGTGRGAAAAVVAASRLSRPPAALVLIAPVR
jgi:dienelactone hydrolase